jgi:hypothetical protein
VLVVCDGVSTAPDSDRASLAAANAAAEVLSQPAPAVEPEERGVEHRHPDDEFPSLAEAERAAGRGAPSQGGRPPESEKRVELPIGVAGALDEAALGKIVKAGIEEAQAVGASFVLKVSP